MTDFVHDLDQQLVAAARRRATRRRRRRGRLPALPGRLVPGLAAAAAIIVAVVGVAAFAGGGAATSEEQIAGEPPAPPDPVGQLTLGSPGTLTTCDDAALGRPVPSGNRPGELLGVLERRRKASDRVPGRGLRAGGAMLLPVSTHLPEETRRVAEGRLAAWVTPTAGVLAEHCGDEPARTRGPGACLTTVRGSFVAARCWTLDDIRGGRAIALAYPRSVVAGLVPDGVQAVEVTVRGRRSGFLATVKDNFFTVRVPGARRGTRLDVVLRRETGARVAFLNGTATRGAAAMLERRLRDTGYPFRTVAVGNAPEQNLASTRVYGMGRNGRAAVEIGAKLAIADIWAGTDELRALAPDADVVVVVGRDMATSGPVDEDGWTPYAPLDEREAREGYQPPPEHKGGGQ